MQPAQQRGENFNLKRNAEYIDIQFLFDTTRNNPTHGKVGPKGCDGFDLTYSSEVTVGSHVATQRRRAPASRIVP